jgi:hypothetical protein
VPEAHQLHAVLLGLHLLHELGDVAALGPDAREHLDDLLVGAAVQRAGQRVDAGRDGGEQVGLGGADQPHGGGRAVLLVVGVQGEQHVQRADDRGVGLVRLGRQPEGHPEEVVHQAEGVVRVEERLPDRLLVRVRRHRRQLAHQPQHRQLELLRVGRVERILVVRRERGHRGGQHRHRVRVAREPVEEALEVLVQQRVPLELVGELAQLGLGRQLAVQQQVADLGEAGVLGQLVDRVAPVAEDAGVTVDVGDLGRTARGVDEPRVVGDQATLGQQPGDVDTGRAFGGVHDGQVLRASVGLVQAQGP